MAAVGRDLSDDFLHRRSRLVTHAGYDVAVGVESDANVSVPEKLLDVLRVDALYQQQGCARVPEVVQPYPRQVRPF